MLKEEIVDVPDQTQYKGAFMAKADEIKVYIFCYEFERSALRIRS